MAGTPVRRPTAFVTGASAGIGAAAAVALARNGFDLALSATKIDNLDATRRAAEALGARACAIELTLPSPDGIERAMSQAIDACGELDVLVNNASGVTYRRAAVDITRDEWNAVLDTVATSTFFLCARMARHLIDGRRAGSIVNLASTHGLVAFPGRAAYGVAKAAVMHMTRMLAIEWAAHGIRVNAVAPGSTATPANAAFMAVPENLAMLKARIPLGRVATADEIGAAIAWLAGPAAAYVTGQTLILDGGLTAA